MTQLGALTDFDVVVRTHRSSLMILMGCAGPRQGRRRNDLRQPRQDISGRRSVGERSADSCFKAWHARAGRPVPVEKSRSPLPPQRSCTADGRCDHYPGAPMRSRRKGESGATHSAVRVAASRSRSTHAPTRKACRSGTSSCPGKSTMSPSSRRQCRKWMATLSCAFTRSMIRPDTLSRLPGSVIAPPSIFRPVGEPVRARGMPEAVPVVGLGVPANIRQTTCSGAWSRSFRRPSSALAKQYAHPRHAAA
jgi:hypothetical protein